jgi:hypothetical protein
VKTSIGKCAKKIWTIPLRGEETLLSARDLKGKNDSIIPISDAVYCLFIRLSSSGS